jgi:hypothetical protein
MSFTITQNFNDYISTNDLDLVIGELSQEILDHHALISNNPANDYISYVFLNGKVIDNWGSDLYEGDNLQQLQNDQGIEYILTYRRDNTNLYDRCSAIITYDFSISTKDCVTDKSRLNSIADIFISSIINNDSRYDSTISTRVDLNNTLIKPRKYSIHLRQTEVVERIDSMSEQLQNKGNTANFLTTIFKLKFKINKQ